MRYTIGALAIATVASAAAISTSPYPTGTYDSEGFTENRPTAELPIQSTYANGKYKYAVFLSVDGMVSQYFSVSRPSY